ILRRRVQRCDFRRFTGDEPRARGNLLADPVDCGESLLLAPANGPAVRPDDPSGHACERLFGRYHDRCSFKVSRFSWPASLLNPQVAHSTTRPPIASATESAHK